MTTKDFIWLIKNFSKLWRIHCLQHNHSRIMLLVILHPLALREALHLTQNRTRQSNKRWITRLSSAVLAHQFGCALEKQGRPTATSTHLHYVSYQLHKPNSPLEGSLVFSFILATDVGHILQDELPVCDPYYTDTGYTTPREKGGSPKEERQTHNTRVNNQASSQRAGRHSPWGTRETHFNQESSLTEIWRESRAQRSWLPR